MPACLDDFSMGERRSVPMAIRGTGRRDGAIVGGVGRFLIHFVRPFSIAHLRRRAGGIRLFFTFRQRLIFLPVFPYPYPQAPYRFRLWRRRMSVRGVGRYTSAGWWCDLAVSLSVPSPRLALRLVRFPRIGLRAGEVRRFCQLVSLRCSISGGADRFPFRLVSRLALSVSCGVSYLFFAICLSSRFTRQFAGVSLSRLAWRFVSCPSVLLVVPRNPALLGSSFSVSPGRLVKQLAFSFRLAARLGGSWGRSGFLCLPSHSLLFSYYFARCVSWPWGLAAARLSYASWRRALFPFASVMESDWMMAAK